MQTHKITLEINVECETCKKLRELLEMFTALPCAIVRDEDILLHATFRRAAKDLLHGLKTVKEKK